MEQDSSRALVRPLAAAVKAIVANVLLIIGGCAWWACHYLTFWNKGVISRGVFPDGFDRVWFIAVATTALLLGLIAVVARRRGTYCFASHIWSFVVVFGGVVGGLAVRLLSNEANLTSTIIASVLTGIGTGLGHVVLGELHARAESGFIPLLFAIEIVGGVVLYLALISLSLALTLAAALLLACASAVLFVAYSRKEISTTITHLRQVVVDANISPLVLLALLIGLTYGFIRNFMAQNVTSWVEGILPFDMLGTVLAAILLVVVFLTQKGKTLFEQCLMFVVPFIATGMLLVPFYQFNSILPIIVLDTGFVSFFMLLNYYSAVLGKATDPPKTTFYVAILFCCISAGQVIGALVPSEAANMFSTELIYLLLIVAIVFFIRQHRKTLKNKVVENELPFEDFAHHYQLSPREIEVFRLLMNRTPYKQMEKTLAVSANTVKTHVRNIYAKTDVSSREELLEMLKEFSA